MINVAEPVSTPRQVAQRLPAVLCRVADMTSRVRRAAERHAVLTVTGPGCDASLLDRLVRSYNDTAPPRPARAIVGTPEDQLERLRSGRADIARG